MADCCSSTTHARPGQHNCPVCGNPCKAVSTTTILHHIKAPWNWNATDQGYYFCATPDCSVVYLGEDNCVIRVSELRTAVGIKQASADALICYCFGVSSGEASSDPAARAFVKQKTRERICACEIRNPSGRCCLKDFPG